MRKSTLESLLRQYNSGKLSKTQIERERLGIENARGKAITRLWYNVLGVDTRRPGSTAPVTTSIR